MLNKLNSENYRTNIQKSFGKPVKIEGHEGHILLIKNIMKNIQFLFILFCINYNAFSQKQLIFESGYFNCFVDNYIIYSDYMKDFYDGEYILYTLNA